MARRMMRAGAFALVLACVAALASATQSGARAAAAVAPGTYTGGGFDACAAPSSATMQAWLSSPYRAVGIYFGGPNRACAQPNLTAAWVSAQQAAGWHLLPVYFGLQPSCTLSTKPYRIDPANAAAQGRASADDAVTAAAAVGLPAGSTLFLDMEAYATGDTACRTAVLRYVSAWNARLHERRYLAGFYSSLASGIADQVAVYGSTSYVRPDYLWFARYDGVATVSNPAIPSTYWAPHRRVKQYLGGHNETYGGVTVNIDNDYVDLAPLPVTPFGDFTRNGWSDLLARETATGYLYLYPGSGPLTFGSRTRVGTGWNAMSAVVRLGDFDRDGYEDVVARERATGYLWLYRGTGAGLTTRIRLGTGWNGLREITAVGDLNRDGFADLVGVQSATGYLYLYPGRGTALGPAVRLGTGWNGLDELTGTGDLTGDGYPDLLARQRSTGTMFLYPGRATGLGAAVQVATQWGGLRDLTGVGDFNRDGRNDLLAVQTATGYLYLFTGRGTSSAPGFAPGVRLGTGWSGLRPLL